MKYLFILGQSPSLAKQEIISLLPEAKIELSGDNFVVLDTKESAESLMSVLGGTIKIASYINIVKDLSKITVEDWSKWLDKNQGQKINFGFSLYGGSKKNQQQLNKLALQVKGALKSEGYKVRLVVSKELILSSVIVSKNKLLKNELLLIHTAQGWVMGLTQAVQDFVNFGFRDIGRPERDDQSGMLPPKVARMMINLGGADRQKTILDPFCGSGTVLQEAALLGFPQIYGSDKSHEAVHDAQANLEWLKQKFNINSEITIKKINVVNLNQHFNANSVDLIVTEPFMGPARQIQKQFKLEYFLQLKNELSDLYLTAWQQFNKILKPGGLVVFIFPVFNLKTGDIHTLDEKNITKLGFSLKNKIVYSRPQQKVRREITYWQKNRD